MGRIVSQSRRSSAMEAIISVSTGFAVSIAASPIVYPLFGHAFTIAQNIGITLVFTVLSLLRSYLVRRFFVWLDLQNEQIEALFKFFSTWRF